MKRKITGCGFSCVDIIKSDEGIVTDIGGTCANVLSILNCLNWEAEIWTPKYEETFFEACLTGRGIKCVQFANTKKKVPRVLQINDKKTSQHKFITRCPQCGNRFAEYVLPTVKQVEKEKYQKGMVFFCDRISEGISKLAEINKANGGYTMYEPNGFRIYEKFINNCKIFDIVKFSEEKLSDRQKKAVLDDLQISAVQLIIMTNGQLGLKFAFRDKNNRLSEWNQMDAVPTDKLKDSSGAGDWLTASFLNCFFSWNKYTGQFQNCDYIRLCLRKAMDIAAMSCGYIGAQGALRDEKIFQEMSLPPVAMEVFRREKPELKDFYCAACGAQII